MKKNPKPLGQVARKPGDVKRHRCTCGRWQPQQRRFAFTAVLMAGSEFLKHGISEPPPNHNWIIGRADEGTRGYSPIVVEGCFEHEKEARDRAAKLNKLSGWKDEGEAQMLVLTTMQIKENHLARLLKRGVELVKQMDQSSEKPEPSDLDEWLKDAAPYAKEAE